MTKAKGVLAVAAEDWASAITTLPHTLADDEARTWKFIEWYLQDFTFLWLNAAKLGTLKLKSITDEASLESVIGPAPAPDEQWPVLGDGNFPFDHVFRACMSAYEASDAQKRLVERYPDYACLPVRVAAISGLTVATANANRISLAFEGTDQQRRATSYGSIIFKICSNLVDDATRERAVLGSLAASAAFLAELVDVKGAK